MGAVVAAATFRYAFVISAALVLTKHHGRFTLDSSFGVQKFHTEPTPRVGGIGIYLGLVLAWVLVRDAGLREILGVLIVAGLVPLVCGLAEDLTKRVSVRLRLLATMMGGAVACLVSGVALDRVDVEALDGLLAIAPLAVIFTAFAVGGVANAINIIDGFHGLASGTTIIALLALASIAAQVGDPQVAMACVLVAAAVGGFWLVNYPWGKLFMGDGGAYFSGFALAWLAVLLAVRNPEVSAWAPLLVCAYPVTEVLYSVARRAARRQSPGAPDSGHLHSLVKLRLIRPALASWDVGDNVRNAAVSPLLWGFSGLLALVATAAFDQPGLLAVGLATGCVAYHLTYSWLAILPDADAVPALVAEDDVEAELSPQ